MRMGEIGEEAMAEPVRASTVAVPDRKASRVGLSANILVRLTPGDGSTSGHPLDLPSGVTTRELGAVLNSLLGEDSRPWAFYISEEEMDPGTTLADAITKFKLSTESMVEVVYKPQAVFRVRAVSRCTGTIAGHTASVLSVQFSPCGRHLASGSGDNSVRLWDINTQTPEKTLLGHGNWILCIAWSPDGRYLISGSMDGEMRLWKADGEAVGGPIKAHKKWVNSLCWEPLHLAAPCTRVASGGKDGVVKVWDAVGKRAVLSLTSHSGSVTCVRWGGSGRLFSASQDRGIIVWNTKTGEVEAQLGGHAHWVNALALSTDYALRLGCHEAAPDPVMTGSKRARGIAVDRMSADEMQSAALAQYSAAAARGGERMASCSDDFTVMLWSTEGKMKSPIAKLTGHQQPVNHVAFSPDGTLLASTSFDKSVRLWNGVTGKFIAALRDHVGAVYHARFSGDNTMVLSCSSDSTLKIWNIRTKKLIRDLVGHADEVFAVDWSSDGGVVASGGRDKVLKLWQC